jgi:hypothetical protein
MKIILTESQYGYLLEASQEEMLRNNFVDTNVVSEEEFETIKRLFNKMSYRVWILESIKNALINVDDILYYVDYFPEFERYRQYYPIRDIKKIKTLGDVERFEYISKMILRGYKDLIQQGMDSLSIKGEIISDDEIKELKSVGINYLGFYDEYQVFQIPQKDGDIKDVWEKYRNILGKCNSKIGGLSKFCTYKGPEALSNYIKSAPLYIFYNVDDALSPYQLHYGKKEFMDRTNGGMMRAVNLLGDERKLDLQLLTRLKNFTKFLINKGLQLDDKTFEYIFSYN